MRKLRILLTPFYLGLLTIVMVAVLVVAYGYISGDRWVGVASKTIWDWLELLIIPAVLGTGGYLFSRSENRRAQAIEQRKGQEQSLQTYLDFMNSLLLDQQLRTSSRENEVRVLARARTLASFKEFDVERKANAIRFLYEAQLLSKDDPIVELGGSGFIGPMTGGANLENIHLDFDFLYDIDLSETALDGANLAFSMMVGARFAGAHMFGANLQNTDLSRADLSHAMLSDSDLSQSILRNANLSGANLERANLEDSDLSHADLSEAELAGARVTQSQLDQCSSLEGATMPDEPSTLEVAEAFEEKHDSS